jgi:hypothetical protein
MKMQTGAPSGNLLNISLIAFSRLRCGIQSGAEIVVVGPGREGVSPTLSELSQR